MRNKYQALVDLYTPPGWTVVQSKERDEGKGGLCSWRHKKIYVPRIRNPYTLAVFFHEVCHAMYHQEGRKMPRHQEEYEAEMYSFRMMIRHGFPVTREMIKNAKFNVRARVSDDIVSKRVMDHEAMRWVA